MKALVRFLSAPLIAAGFVWQFISGGFLAGRILANIWLSGLVNIPPRTPSAPPSSKAH